MLITAILLFTLAACIGLFCNGQVFPDSFNELLADIDARYLELESVGSGQDTAN